MFGVSIVPVLKAHKICFVKGLYTQTGMLIE